SCQRDLAFTLKIPEHNHRILQVLGNLFLELNTNAAVHQPECRERQAEDTASRESRNLVRNRNLVIHAPRAINWFIPTNAVHQLATEQTYSRRHGRSENVRDLLDRPPALAAASRYDCLPFAWKDNSRTPR